MKNTCINHMRKCQRFCHSIFFSITCISSLWKTWFTWKTDNSTCTIKINLHFTSIKSKYIYILFSICALFLPKPDRTWENTSPFGISVINTQRRDFTEKKCCFWWIVGKFSAKIIIKRSMEVAYVSGTLKDKKIKYQ